MSDSSQETDGHKRNTTSIDGHYIMTNENDEEFFVPNYVGENTENFTPPCELHNCLNCGAYGCPCQDCIRDTVPIWLCGFCLKPSFQIEGSNICSNCQKPKVRGIIYQNWVCSPCTGGIKTINRPKQNCSICIIRKIHSSIYRFCKKQQHQ